MTRVLDPFRFVLIAVAGWMNQRQLQIIDYLREENRVLREQLGERRVRFNDDQRRRLTSKAKGLGRKLLREVATLVTPETLLAWHRKLISLKYDGTAQRGLGRPKIADEIETLDPFFMGRIESARNLRGTLQCDMDGYGTLQRLALDEFHHEGF